MRRYFLFAYCFILVGCEYAAPPTPPAPITVAESDALAPTTAVDPAGETAYWSWFGRNSAGTSTIFVARAARGDTVASTPVEIDLGGHEVNVHAQAPPQVIAGPRGSVYVAWTSNVRIEGRRFPASHVLLSRSRDGGRTFDPPVVVNDDADGPPAGHTFHDAAVDSDGMLYVSWLDSRDDVDVHDHSDAAHAMASNTTVRVARSDDGGESFSPSVLVASATCQCCRTSLAVHADSTVYVAWRHIYGTDVRDIAVARSGDGGRTFTDPVRVFADGWAIEGCPHNGPSLAIGTDGKLTVAWFTAADGRVGLHQATSTDRGRSFTATPISFEVAQATARVAAGPHSTWLTWEEQGTIHIADDDRFVGEYEGSYPALDAGGDLVSIAWTADGALQGALIDALR